MVLIRRAHISGSHFSMNCYVCAVLFVSLLSQIQADVPSQYAAILREFGSPDKFTIENNWPIPEDYGDDECWILVKASAVYPWDKYARQNNGTRARLNAPVVIGQEVAGIVIQCGPNIKHIKKADRIFAKMPNFKGGYKQIVLTKGNETYFLPDNVTYEQGCVSFYPYVTAHKALVHRAKISPGKSILIIGGNRDVGRAAIQVAKEYGCYPIVATAGTDDAVDHLMAAGASDVVNHSDEGFRASAMVINNYEKFDVILNNVFPDGYQYDMDFVKHPGGHVLYHTMTDIERETRGFDYYNDSISPDLVNNSIQHVVKGLLMGLYKPHVNKTFYLGEIKGAHETVENPDLLGDIVLTKVHDDSYIHLSSCECNKSIDKPRTHIGPI